MSGGAEGDAPVPGELPALAWEVLSPPGEGDGGRSGSLPLVVLHGLFGSRGNWRTLARRLARERPVFLLDAPGHGGSGRSRRLDYLVQAAALRRWLDEQGLAEVVLLGHSMGGKTAMTTALLDPGRVRGLVVVDVAPLAAPTGRDETRAELDRALQAMRALAPARLRSRTQADAAMAGALPDPRLRAFLLHNLERDPEGEGFRWRLDLEAIEESLAALRSFPAPETLARAGALPYPGPALFIRGGRSPYVPPGALPRIRELFPRARIETVEDAGHWVHAERPEAVQALVERFLRDELERAPGETPAGEGTGPPA